MSDALLQVHVAETLPGVRIVEIVGEVDLSNVTMVEQQLNDVADNATQLTVDLTSVSYLDSQGLRMLQRLADRYACGEFDLTLVVNPSDVVHRLLTITRFDLTVPIVSDRRPSGETVQ